MGGLRMRIRPPSPFHRILFLFCLIWISTTLASYYEWEDWDYYQILGLQRSDANSTTVKQAYRRQAKEWHPDKQQHKKDNGSSDNQEATERFRRIAEAYQVLSDPEQRQEYDSYLLQLQQQQQQQHHHHRYPYAYTASQSESYDVSDNKPFFSWRKFIEMDPFKVFEEFFFAQEEEEEVEEHGWWFGGGQNTASSRDLFADVEHEQSLYMHPKYGQVLRVSRHEHDEHGHRIIYQDFVEDWDPYRRAWGWYPITPEPMMFVPTDTLRGSLEPPNVLQQGPFTAGFYDCQLQIRRGSSVLWRVPSEEDYDDPFGGYMAKRCSLSLVGSRLVLRVNGRVIWKTPMAAEEVAWQQSIHHRARPNHFEARLDYDGSLVVYRNEMMMSHDKNSIQLLEQLKMWLWKDPRCCYSTSPVGCHRLGRLLVRILTLDRRLDDILRRLGELYDRFIDWLDGEDEDEPF